MQLTQSRILNLKSTTNLEAVYDAQVQTKIDEFLAIWIGKMARTIIDMAKNKKL